MGELKLETITLHQDPSFLVEIVRSYVPRSRSQSRGHGERNTFATGLPLRNSVCSLGHADELRP